MKPRILLTGKNGQVGRELEHLLAPVAELKAVGRNEMDLANPGAIRRAISEFHPQFIVNAAAYTAVDRAESEEPIARVINAEAPGIMAEEATKIGAALIHFSTDYVFDGSKSEPYSEDDATNPISAYGRTKLAGEKAIQKNGGNHLVFRTEWVYATSGKNFLLTILRLACEREELRIVSDQIGAPTWSREIAKATAKVILDEWQRASGGDLFRGRGGIYHMTAEGRTTWYGFASAIVDYAHSCRERPLWFREAVGDRPLVVQRIMPIATKDYPTPAARPANSLLANARLEQVFGVKLPDWRIQLRAALTSEDRE
jgi:dTDP-4-dehydrorhamnose reductase